MEEKELIGDLLSDAGRDKAFARLVEAYGRQLYAIIRRMVIDHDDADDLLQNVWVKAWQNLDRFKGDSKIFTWLYRIAVNEAITFLNKKRRRLLLPIHDVEKELATKVDTASYIDADEVQKRFEKAVLALPEKQRLVFNMRYHEELTYEQMSEVLGTSVGALKASYHHAVKKLENYLQKPA